MKTKFNVFLTLLLAFMVQIAFAQTKTVTGNVTDSSGPLPGVTVVVMGTDTGTQTDFDGNYSINASVGDVLQFSYVGMETAERTVGGSNVIDITMVESAEALEEVVVVGYGTERKGKVTGSVSVIKSEKLASVPIGSFDQILQGQAPGLYVTAGSGQPGASAKVRIRGTHSINGGNNPLYILDGTPITAGDFASFNTSDFASVTVLKDAASVSIYGSRGASGVILITSNKGRYDNKTTFTYKSQFGLSEKGKAKSGVMNAYQKMQFDNILTPGTWTETDIEDAKTNTTNWEDYFFRTGYIKSHELSATGGGESTKFYTSASYYDQEGIGVRSDLKRFQVRLNLENKPSEKITIGLNTFLGYTKSNFIDSENDISLQNPYAAVYLGSPYNTPYDEDGNFNTGSGKVGANSLENLYKNQNFANDFKLIGNIFGEVEVFKNIKARLDIGIDYLQSRTVQAASPDTYYGAQSEPGNEGFYLTNNIYRANINTTSSINYSNIFNDVHNLSVSLFTEYYKYNYDSNGFTGYGINPKLVGYPEGITPGTTDNELIPVLRGLNNERGLFSYFGNVKYEYDNKYKIDLTLRRDASSRFSEENKWGTFWAVGFLWDIKGESFMLNSNLFNRLQFRASYGITGNQEGIGSFQDEGQYGTTSYAGESGIAPISIGNNQLKWEESEKLSVGFEFGLFEDRLSGAIEGYYDTTSDLFISQSLSRTSGFASIDANAGEMVNKGVDININGTVLKSEYFKFILFTNFNYNNNEITDLGQVEEYESGTSIIRKGLPYGTHYIVGWAGVNPVNGEPLYLDADQNITNVYSAENSLAIFGSSEPVYTGSFGTEITYKNFGLSTLFTFAGDYFRFNNQTYFQENPNFNQYNMSTVMSTIWQNPGDITDIQSDQYNRAFSSKDIENASYIRFRNITLAYNFSKDILEELNVFKGVRFYVQAQNLYTWTNFTGFDPEDDNNIAAYEYPTPKTYTFGVDLKF